MKAVVAGWVGVGAMLVMALAGTPAWGQSTLVPGSWSAGPGAQGDNTYVGLIETPASGASVQALSTLTLTGWFVDTTAQGWAGVDDIQVFLGAMDTGGVSLGRATIGLNRPDIAGTFGNPYWSAAGWQALVSTSALPAGESALSVYAHTPAKGWWFLQTRVSVGQTVSSTGEILAPAPALQGVAPTVTVSVPTENQLVSTRIRIFPLSGTATDPKNGPLSIDWVEVWFNGEANSDTGVFLGVADQSRDGSWSLPFDPGKYLPIDSNLYVYAHSGVTGKKTLVVRHFRLNDRPADQ